AHAIGRLHRMMLEVDQQDLVARLAVREADAAGICRFGDPALGAAGRQIFLGQPEQMGEVLGRQTGNAEAHDPTSMALHTYRRMGRGRLSASCGGMKKLRPIQPGRMLRATGAIALGLSIDWAISSWA